MKLFLILLVALTSTVCAKKIGEDTMILGKPGSGADKTLWLNTALTRGVRSNETLGQTEFTNDGAVWTAIGAGSAGLTKQFTLGEDLTQGDAVTVLSDGLLYKALDRVAGGQPDADFEVSDVRLVTIAKLDDTRMVVSYNEAAGNVRAKQTVATFSGLSISYGTLYETSTDNNVDNPTVAKINTDKTVQCWYDTDKVNGVYCAVSTWSGSTRSAVGTEVTVIPDASVFQGSAFQVEPDVFELDTDKFGVCARENEAGGEGSICVVATVSGTTISAGATSTLAGSGSAGVQGACKVATDKFAVFKQSIVSAGTVGAYIATVSGTTITEGTAVNVHTGRQGITNCKPLDTDKIVSFVEDAGGYVARVHTISGTTITSGTEFSVGGSGAGGMHIMIKDIDEGAFIYQNTGLKFREWSVSGTTLSYSAAEADVTPNTGSEADGVYMGASLETPAICYRDTTDSDGTCRSISNVVTNASDYIGVIQNTQIAGNTETVNLTGSIADFFSGKTPGPAYIQADGTVDSTPTSDKIGAFLTATELLVQ